MLLKGKKKLCINSNQHVIDTNLNHISKETVIPTPPTYMYKQL